MGTAVAVPIPPTIIRFINRKGEAGIAGHRNGEVAGVTKRDADFYIKKELAELVGDGKPDPVLACLHGQVPKAQVAALLPGQFILCDCGAKVEGSQPLEHEAQPRTDLVAIRYLVPVPPYRKGEIVGHLPKIAAELCAMEAQQPATGPIAELVGEPELKALAEEYARKTKDAANEHAGGGTVLRFMEAYGKYRTGEVAAFSVEHAAFLLGLVSTLVLPARDGNPMVNRIGQPVVEEIKDGVDLAADPPRVPDRKWKVEGTPAEAVNLTPAQQKAVEDARDKMLRPGDIKKK